MQRNLNKHVSYKAGSSVTFLYNNAIISNCKWRMIPIFLLNLQISF